MAIASSDTGSADRLAAYAIRRARLAVVAIVVSVACCHSTRGQEVPRSQQEPAAPVPGATAVQVRTAQGKTTTCYRPPPMVSWEDYQGPFAKVVGVFGRRIERKEVHRPDYKPDATLCTLEVKEKFVLFVDDAIDPLTFLSAAFNSGISQAEDDDPSYGQGAAGYGRRVGYNLIDQAQADFFIDFAYPTIFAEDPRYYRLGHGSTGRRLLHAVEHSVVGYRENGSMMPNCSLWFGTVSAATLSNVYHPDNRRGVAPMARRVGIAVGYGVGFDVLREFWPEVARKFKLPFREEREAGYQKATAPRP